MGDIDGVSNKLGELTGTVKALVDNTNLRFAERAEASRAQYAEINQKIDTLVATVDKLASTVATVRLTHAKRAGGTGAVAAIGVVMAKFMLDKAGVHF